MDVHRRLPKEDQVLVKSVGKRDLKPVDPRGQLLDHLSRNIVPLRSFLNYPPMCEPLHDTASEIPSKRIANPVSQIQSGATHLGKLKAARATDQKPKSGLESSELRTCDHGGDVSTRDFGKAKQLSAVIGPA
jgi:Isocitrate/isopropylmalate dehydrogenase